MFVTTKRLKEKIRKIYDSMEFIRDNAIQNAVIEVETKSITPILEELNKLEERIQKLEKHIKED